MDIQMLFYDFMYWVMELDEITSYTVLFLIGVFLVILILRIILSILYQKQLTAFRLSKKDKPSRLLGKIINDYKASGSKGIANINTEQIVNKYIIRLNFIGWGLDSIDGFIKKVENQIGFIGVVTLFIPDTDKLWCAGTTATILILLWFFSSIFDYSSTKTKLIVELIDYIDNLEGVFYVKDLGATILTFKNELQSTILNTNKVLSDAIHKMNTSINESLKYGSDNMVLTLNKSMKALTDYSEILREPMNSWRENIEKADNLQVNFNTTINTLEQSMSKFETIYDKLDKQLNEHSNALKGVGLNLNKQVEQLFSSVYNLDENAKAISLNNETIQKQLKYIEDNQQLLNVTLQKYQGTIEDFTSNIGDAFGNIINLYSQNANETIANEISRIVVKFMDMNKEIVSNINQSIDKLTKHGIMEQQAIIEIKEQLTSKQSNL